MSMSPFELLAGVAVVLFVAGYALRMAFVLGRAERIVEARIRMELDDRLNGLMARLDSLEEEDAIRRRQMHDMAEEYKAVIGPTHRESVNRVIQETVAKDFGEKGQRYGLGPNP